MEREVSRRGRLAPLGEEAEDCRRFEGPVGIVVSVSGTTTADASITGGLVVSLGVGTGDAAPSSSIVVAIVGVMVLSPVAHPNLRPI